MVAGTVSLDIMKQTLRYNGLLFSPTGHRSAKTAVQQQLAAQFDCYVRAGQ
jgi:hypothetical protein